MTIAGALLLLSVGGLAVVGCGGDGGADATCGDGGPCGADGRADATCADGGPCGGDGGPAPTCGKVQPCGGDVVGDWTFVEVCESAASIAALKADFAKMAAESWCVGQTLVGVEPAASGSLVFGADGTYSLALLYGGTLDINYPASCLAGLSCDDATAGFQSQIDAGAYPVPTVTSIACAGSSNCVCRATVDSPRSAAGTYSISSGSVLTFTATTGTTNTKSYCVEGNALHVLDTSSDLIAMKR